MTVKKLLWTFTFGLAATAVYLVIREATGSRRDEAPVGYVGNETPSASAS